MARGKSRSAIFRDTFVSRSRARRNVSGSNRSRADIHGFTGQDCQWWLAVLRRWHCPLGISELIIRGSSPHPTPYPSDRIGLCRAHRTNIYTCVIRNHYLMYTSHTSCNRRIAGVVFCCISHANA